MKEEKYFYGRNVKKWMQHKAEIIKDYKKASKILKRMFDRE